MKRYDLILWQKIVQLFCRHKEMSFHEYWSHHTGNKYWVVGKHCSRCLKEYPFEIESDQHRRVVEYYNSLKV